MWVHVSEAPSPWSAVWRVRKAAGWWVRAEEESRKKTEARDTFPPRIWDPTRVAGAGPALAEPSAPAGRAHGAEMVPK